MITLALVLTPVASAPALAGLLGLAGIDVDVVPTSRGAVVVRAVGTPDPEVPDDLSALTADDGAPHPPDDVPASDPWDISALFDDGVPAEARELASAISRLTRLGVVLVTARLAQDSGIETGLSGTIQAQRFEGGEPGDEVPGGLVIAGADDVVEDLLLGRTSVAQVKGHVNSREATGGRTARWFGKGLRKPRP